MLDELAFYQKVGSIIPLYEREKTIGGATEPFKKITWQVIVPPIHDIMNEMKRNWGEYYFHWQNIGDTKETLIGENLIGDTKETYILKEKSKGHFFEDLSKGHFDKTDFDKENAEVTIEIQWILEKSITLPQTKLKAEISLEEKHNTTNSFIFFQSDKKLCNRYYNLHLLNIPSIPAEDCPYPWKFDKKSLGLEVSLGSICAMSGGRKLTLAFREASSLKIQNMMHGVRGAMRKTKKAKELVLLLIFFI